MKVTADNYNILTFRPTWEEFQDFNSLIQIMEAHNAHKAGIAKIIPPVEWVPRKNGYYGKDIMRRKIKIPISQTMQGHSGVYLQSSRKEDAMTVKQFKIMSESEKYRTPDHSSDDDLEDIYWKNTTHVPYYGADVAGYLTDDDVDVCNIRKLNTILDYIKDDYKVLGVNTPYLYFGMWRATFAWHIEDMDLYSINYIHTGYPKTWYAIPPEHGHLLEKLVAKLFPNETSSCNAFLRHKMAVIAPEVLKHNNIPFGKITHNSGEIMITFPYGYHSGFNHGFNMAESINFASPRWVDYGKHAKLCSCPEMSVSFNMNTFVKRLQPKKYKLWLENRDLSHHPEDPNFEKTKRGKKRPITGTKRKCQSDSEVEEEDKGDSKNYDANYINVVIFGTTRTS